MGDAETEAVLLRIQNDFVSFMEATAKQQLANTSLEVDPRAAVTVMLVSGGYPEAYEKGKDINGLENVKDSIVFHAGTKMENGKVVTNGGRVLAVSSLAEDYQEALKKSYQNIKQITFDKMYYRTDIGFDL